MNNDILNIPHNENDEDFLNYKNTLEKEPEGDVKKGIVLGAIIQKIGNIFMKN